MNCWYMSMQVSLVDMRSLMMCLMRPSGERHLARLHDVQPALVLFTELLGGFERLGVEIDMLHLGVRPGAFAGINALAHIVCVLSQIRRGDIIALRLALGFLGRKLRDL